MIEGQINMLHHDAKLSLKVIEVKEFLKHNKKSIFFRVPVNQMRLSLALGDHFIDMCNNKTLSEYGVIDGNLL